MVDNARDRHAALFVQNLEIQFHDAVQIVNLYAPRDQGSHGVAKEQHRLMVGGEGRVPFEQGALVRRVQIFFQRRQAALSSGVEEVVQETQRVEIDAGSVAASLEDSQNAADDGLQDVRRITDQHGPDGRAADDQQLGGLHEHQQVALFHQVAAGYTAQNDYYAYDWKHPVGRPRISWNQQFSLSST